MYFCNVCTVCCNINVAHTHNTQHTHNTHTTHTQHTHTHTHTHTSGYESALTAPDDPASSLSPTQSSVTTFGRKGTVHKDINRFTSFVKTGTEPFILGKVTAKGTDADKITIVVGGVSSSHSLWVGCIRWNRLNCVLSWCTWRVLCICI